MNILLIGRTQPVIDEAITQLTAEPVTFLSATNIDAVRQAFTTANIDHVIMGAGIDLDTRLQK